MHTTFNITFSIQFCQHFSISFIIHIFFLHHSITHHHTQLTHLIFFSFITHITSHTHCTFHQAFCSSVQHTQHCHPAQQFTSRHQVPQHSLPSRFNINSLSHFCFNKARRSFIRQAQAFIHTGAFPKQGLPHWPFSLVSIITGPGVHFFIPSTQHCRFSNHRHWHQMGFKPMAGIKHSRQALWHTGWRGRFSGSAIGQHCIAQHHHPSIGPHQQAQADTSLKHTASGTLAWHTAALPITCHRHSQHNCTQVRHSAFSAFIMFTQQKLTLQDIHSF